MYKLTSRMVQNLERSLTQFHSLFQGKRCDSWQMEELITRAINSDTAAKHHAKWTEGGHDDKADIVVIDNKKVTHSLQIKSGVVVNKMYDYPTGRVKLPSVVISGHRLTRFNNNFTDINNYLRSRKAEVLAVPCATIDDVSGRVFEYVIKYLDPHLIYPDCNAQWSTVGKGKKGHFNQHGAYLTVTNSLSSQVWWQIPEHLFISDKVMSI